MRPALTFFILLAFGLIGCGGSDSSIPPKNKGLVANEAGTPGMDSDGGYSGGGGDINAYGADEFKSVFKEAVDYAKRLHLSVPFYFMFLKFDNKLPEQFEEILAKALEVGEGQVGLIKEVEINFDSLCSSSTKGESHASVDYTLESVVCISSLGLELMSKTELRRKLLALLSHEYVHMLGFKSEELANELQLFIYNNYYMISGNDFTTNFRGSLQLLYEKVYYFLYRDCVLLGLCSDKLEISASRLLDLQQERPRREALLSILGKIEAQLYSLEANYRGDHFLIDSTLVDENIWSISDDFLYVDFRKLEEFKAFQNYILENKSLDEQTLKTLARNLVRRFFKLNFIDRTSQIGLVSRTLYFNYCVRPFPMHTEATSDLLDTFFDSKDFTYKTIDQYLSEFGIQTIYYGSEVIYLPQNRMCSTEDKTIPAYAGKPTEPSLVGAIPLYDRMQSYIMRAK